MQDSDTAHFTKLYGVRKPRTMYYAKDFVDYVIMLTVSTLIVAFGFGVRHVLSIAWFVLVPFMLAMFVVRHGVELKVPLILRRPQDVLYMIVYKIRNLHPLWLVAVGVLVLEQVAIALTPNLPHNVELMRTAALWLFFLHFVAITVFRTVILVDHLSKKEMVREILMQTPWKRSINQKTNITLEILHAYVTGVLAHIILLVPWYLLITNAKYSLIFLPVAVTINLLVQRQWIRVLNRWFYRDHWLGHNSEFEFLYLHGGHHDAIPSGLLAAGDTGLLEGLLRHAVAAPVTFNHPIAAFFNNTYEVANDIHTHQYIPGVFPRLSKRFIEVAQHSTHHFGQLEPYTFALNVDQPYVPEHIKKAWRLMPYEFANCIKLDEQVSGFKWDNPTHRNFISLHEKYQPPKKQAVNPKPAESVS